MNQETVTGYAPNTEQQGQQIRNNLGILFDPAITEPFDAFASILNVERAEAKARIYQFFYQYPGTFGTKFLMEIPRATIIKLQRELSDATGELVMSIMHRIDHEIEEERASKKN